MTIDSAGWLASKSKNGEFIWAISNGLRTLKRRTHPQRKSISASSLGQTEASHMDMSMPPVRQVVSPNYSARSAAIRLIVVHDTEGSYAGAVSWFAQTASQVSAHLVMNEDGSAVTQMVPLSEKAWHACSANSISIGIEGAGVEAKGYSDAWWRGMAKIVAWLLHAYGLPCRWAQGGSGEGYCSHHDLGAAGGGHSDPVAIGSPQWTVFGGYVQEVYQAFSGAPLPAFALHGVPNPSMVALPPEVAPEPSHGGAQRSDPGAGAPAHPTLTGYPVASIHDWQERLRIVGANPTLLIDGQEGAGTRAAIGTFQRAVGLPVTNEVNPATWAKLYAATEKIAA